jgi:hypothetical protein
MARLDMKCYYDIEMSKIRSQLVLEKDVIGEFSLNMYTPFQLEVYIDDNFQGMGLSTYLLQNFAKFLGKPKDGKYTVVEMQEGVKISIKLNEDVLLAIDVDASANERGESWWGKIGMVNNRHCNTSSARCIDITGYEKIITLKSLLITIAKMKENEDIYFRTTAQQSMQKRQKTTRALRGKSKKGIKNK